MKKNLNVRKQSGLVSTLLVHCLSLLHKLDENMTLYVMLSDSKIETKNKMHLILEIYK